MVFLEYYSVMERAPSREGAFFERFAEGAKGEEKGVV